MTRFTLSGKRRALFEKMLEQDGASAGRRAVIPRREGGGPWPLSFAQRRLWFLNQLSPQSPFYNVFTAVPLRVPVDGAVMRRSLNEIVRRHESLRTTFMSDGGEPVQMIAPEVELDLPQIDLTHLPAAERDAESDRIAAEAARTPFDLASGPLFRASLVHKSPQDFVLLLVLHHIVCDGWSLSLIGAELRAFYAAYLSGRAPALPPLPIQFADFAAWQSQWLTERRAARADRLLEAAAGCHAAAGAPGGSPAPRDRLVSRGAPRRALSGAPLGSAARALSRGVGDAIHGPAGGLRGRPASIHGPERHRDRHPDVRAHAHGNREPDRVLRQHAGHAGRPVGRPDVPGPGAARYGQPRWPPTTTRTCRSRRSSRRYNRNGIWRGIRCSRSCSSSSLRRDGRGATLGRTCR